MKIIKDILSLNKAKKIINNLYGHNGKAMTNITENNFIEAKDFLKKHPLIMESGIDSFLNNYTHIIIDLKLCNLEGREYKMPSVVKQQISSNNKNDQILNSLLFDWLILENEIIMFNKFHDSVVEKQLQDSKDLYQVEGLPHLVRIIKDLDNPLKSQLFFATTTTGQYIYQGFLGHFDDEVSAYSQVLLNKLEDFDNMAESKMGNKKSLLDLLLIRKEISSYYPVLYFANLSLDKKFSQEQLHKLYEFKTYCNFLNLDYKDELLGKRYDVKRIKDNSVFNSFFSVSLIKPTEIARRFEVDDTYTENTEVAAVKPKI